MIARKLKFSGMMSDDAAITTNTEPFVHEYDSHLASFYHSISISMFSVLFSIVGSNRAEQFKKVTIMNEHDVDDLAMEQPQRVSIK